MPANGWDWGPLNELVDRLEILQWWAENQPTSVQVVYPTWGFGPGWEWPAKVPVILAAELIGPPREPAHVREARAWVRQHYPHAEPRRDQP